MFRRRRRDDDADPEIDADDEAADGAEDEPAEVVAPARPAGPWDSTDAPEDDLPRLDLGALLVPASEGLEIRVDVQEETVVAATLVDGPSAMQVHAFAAPRSSGIWSEVRAEIAESLRETGGSAEETDGPFGPELRARVPAPPPDQGGPPGGGTQPVRFIGIDGPRWFLRALLSGPAATDPAQGRRLLDAFRATIVVRGGEAMAPREMLPLRLPREALAADTEPEEQRPGLEMLERGPEITETQ